MLPSTALLLLPLVAASPYADLFARGGNSGKDKFHGKTLAPNNYTVVDGLFVQDDPAFNATGYDLLKDSFGLIDKSKDRWKKFTKHITDLNKNADAYTTYKVIYIARHGEGYHNVAEHIYGSDAWNCYWSLQYGDGNMTWGDATLTPLGEDQARAANAGWKEQIKAGIPVPQVLYSSPFRRAASTLDITWTDILLNKGVKPVFKEGWREMIGLHTCDERSNRTVLAQTYPKFTFEPSFTEHDPLWDDVFQESHAQQARRIRLAVGELFANDPSTFVSVTAHSGVINAFFKAVGHRPLQVQTGGFVPVVIKAVSYPSATFSHITGGASYTAPICTADPTTKVQAPATVTVAPTWYPACTAAPSVITSFPATGCLTQPVTGPTAAAKPTGA
ncbi:putative phosphoglycerate mutase [Vanrija pseudolonga]|uniref:Phosphoglycerate mutase n=1 Tax=Vanrija pseudolonga TaxID=143232 RepID=A0AAF1BRN0_9TREE|nr:putative phosphoglycerate mutase [Vanrija pseudolonga]